MSESTKLKSTATSKGINEFCPMQAARSVSFVIGKENIEFNFCKGKNFNKLAVNSGKTFAKRSKSVSSWTSESSCDFRGDRGVDTKIRSLE